MRNAARLEVGQSLVESSRRSILRATMESAKFTRKELEMLYKWFEVKNSSVLRFMFLSLLYIGRASTSSILG